ncbi:MULTISPECIES: hypothetical protein [unclassified Staphylococcus]|uniref:hypothetical protein n=1 Tax=unclassified Staphylococcus TaxID=91994 RepID=UPI001AEBCDEE|nr:MULTISPECIES: hypothetical protein [unclassified Staphylococcus]
MMASIDYVTTKGASEILGVSTATLRTYAQHMEYVGYDFKKENNTRQFGRHDLEIIKEAMDRFKYKGGTMKNAIHYVVVKEIKGVEYADSLDSKNSAHPTNSVPANAENFKNELSEILESKIGQKLDLQLEELLKRFDALEDNNAQNEFKEANNQLLQKNERLEKKIEDLQLDIKEYQKKNDAQRSKNEELELKLEIAENNEHFYKSEVEELSEMGIFEFRKWKKER